MLNLIFYQAKARAKLNPHGVTSLDAVRYFAEKWDTNGNPYGIHQKIADSCFICQECLEVTLQVILKYWAGGRAREVYFNKWCSKVLKVHLTFTIQGYDQ